MRYEPSEVKFVRTFGIELVASAVTAAIVAAVVVLAPFPRVPSAAAVDRALEISTRYSLDAVSFGTTTTILRWHPQPVLRAARGDAIVVTGWAVDAAAYAPAGGVRAVVDGKLTFTAPIDRPRPDVAAVLHAPSLARSGFRLTIPGCTLRDGSHRIAFRFLTAARDAYYRSRDDVDIFVGGNSAAGRAMATIDDIAPSAGIAGVHRILGWAIDPSQCEPVLGIRVLIDGRPVARGMYGLLRRDVAAHLGVPAYASTGFSARYDDDDLAPGPHTLAIQASLGPPAQHVTAYALRFERSTRATR